jgi:rubrerythrin
MAIRTPPQSTKTAVPERASWDDVEVSATTASRAVRPPAVVDNRRMVTHTLAESRLVWRCDDCGEVGHLTAFPAACPNCSAPREALYYFRED